MSLRKFQRSLIDFVDDLEMIFPKEELTMKEQINAAFSGKESAHADLHAYGAHIRKEKRHPKTLLKVFKKHSYDIYVERYKALLFAIQRKPSLRKIYLLPGVNFSQMILDDSSREAICSHLEKLYRLTNILWNKKYDELLLEPESDSDDEESSDDEEFNVDFLAKGAKSILLTEENKDYECLIDDTTKSVMDKLEEDEDFKKSIVSIKGPGDIAKIFANDKFASMLESLGSTLAKNYSEKIEKGEINRDNLSRASGQLKTNLESFITPEVRKMMESVMGVENVVVEKPKKVKKIKKNKKH